MGRKAVSYLLISLFIVFSAGAAVVSGLCRYAATVPPAAEFWPTLAFLTPAVLVLNLLLLLFWLFKRRWWVALIPLAGLVIGAPYIDATLRWPQFFKPAEKPYDLRLATLNAHGFKQMGKVQTTVYGIDRIIANENIDVMCFQEFGTAADFSADSIAAFLSDRLPYFIQSGSQAIASRYPILTHDYVRFPGSGNDFMWADLKIGGRTIRVVSVHFQTSGIAVLSRSFRKNPKQGISVGRLLGTLETNNRIRAGQVAQIKALIDTTRYPVVVAGDFNDTPSSYTYHRLKQKMSDGFRASGHGFGSTFRPLGGVLRIDYILYNSQLKSQNYRILNEEVSDHKMVVAELIINSE